MASSTVARAVSAAVAVARSLGLPAEGAAVLHSSNKLALRLTPCDVLARVAHDGQQDARLELERAARFAGAGCPVGAAHPSVDPVVHMQDGFAVTLWTYYEPTAPEVPPGAYARALLQLHTGMRTVDLASPSCTERIAEAEQVADDPALSPELGDADRALLGSVLRTTRRSIEARGAPEQLLHGEPHPGNVLSTQTGPLFVDFETICRGPLELDMAHVPEDVADRYPGLDRQLLDDCRRLVLAMVAAWRWRVGDEFPDRSRWGRLLLRTLDGGPPWPTLDALTGRLEHLCGP